MANAYIAAPSLGVTVALAIAVHNLPEEFAIALPAVALKKKNLSSGLHFYPHLPNLQGQH